jgi:hypothetical protein
VIFGEDPIMFIEKTQRSSIVHIQQGPDPLAR